MLLPMMCATGVPGAGTALGRCVAVGVLGATLVLGLPACTYGPQMLPRQHAGYGQAIHRSTSEQLLTNLVQLRYRESPSMLDLTQIVSQFQFESDASVGATLQSGSSQVPLSLSGSVRETPTVTYVPVTGQKFAIRMLTPLHPYQVFLMSRSGWDLRRLMTACIEEVNGLENFSTSVGFVPKTPPRTLEEFTRVTLLMEDLEIADALETVAVTRGRPAPTQVPADGSGLDDVEFEMRFREKIDDPLIAEKARELKRLLHLDPAKNRFPIHAVLEQFAWESGKIALQTRSLLSVMLFLAGSIAIPEDGREIYPASFAGVDADPSRMGPRSIFQVHTSDSEPEGAAVAVQVRDHWFWIADGDANSKTTFALLGYLVRLQEAREGGGAPGVLLTIPTG